MGRGMVKTKAEEVGHDIIQCNNHMTVHMQINNTPMCICAYFLSAAFMLSYYQEKNFKLLSSNHTPAGTGGMDLHVFTAGRTFSLLQ